MALDAADPARAERVRARSSAYVTAIAPDYPGDLAAGALREEENLPSGMDHVACPALDPDSGLCRLYAARPITCRTFGAATRVREDTVAACEVCHPGPMDDGRARRAARAEP